MGQDKEQPEAPPEPQAKKPSIGEIIEHWNVFGDNSESIGAYMMQNGRMTMAQAGKVSDAVKIIAEFLEGALGLNNDQTNQELQLRNEAEKGIRAEHMKKLGAEHPPEASVEETPAATILSMSSKDNDPKPAPKKRGTKPKANVRKKPTKQAAKKNAKKK